MAYLTHPIHDSHTICGEAGAAIQPMTAVKFNADGKIVPAAAGDVVLGIALATTDDCKAGGTVHVQIKDGTIWMAGGEFAAGDLLAADANGNAVKAESGVALGIALEAGKAGVPAQFYISRLKV